MTWRNSDPSVEFENNGLNRRQYMGSLATVGAAALAGCSGDEAEDGTIPESITIGWHRDITSLDPALSGVGDDFNAIWCMAENLFRVNAEGDVEPHLVDEVEREDAETWNFILKEGIEFQPPHDRELVAEDVIANFERVTNENVGSPRVHNVDFAEWSVIDDHTFEANFTDGPNAAAEAHLAGRGPTIIAPEVFEDDPQASITEPVGTGPFQYEEWVEGEHLTLTKFDNYWMDDLPHVEQVIFTEIVEDAVRATELRNGDIQFDWQPSSEEIPAYEEDENITVDSAATTLGRNQIEVNCGDNVTEGRGEELPTTDMEVRAAIQEAIDREAYAEIIWDGNATPAQTLYPADHPWGTDYSPWPNEAQPEAAEERLEEAGYDLPVEITILSNPEDPVRGPQGEILESQLSDAGFDPVLEELEEGLWLDRLTSMEFDLATGTGSLGPDPNMHSTSRHMSTNEDVAPYYGSEDSNYERVFDLFEQARETTNTDEREEIYAEAQELIVDDTSYIMTVHYDIIQAYRNNINDFKVNPDGEKGHNLHEISLESGEY